MKKNNEELYKLWDEFLTKWPVERIKQMKLEEYTSVGSTETFTYWIESRMDKIGSIWGGSSFKFGVFSRDVKEPKEDERGRSYSERYAWYTKYGNNPEEAFSRIKSLILEIINYASSGEVNSIDNIDLGDAFKWKIASLYQNRENPKIVTIFSAEALLYLAGKSNRAIKRSDLYLEIIKGKPQNLGIIEYSKELWERYSKHIRIWKVSHGSNNFTRQEMEEFLGKKIIVVHGETKKKQGEDFIKNCKKGDYFYLCHGNDGGIKLFGKITSDARASSKGPGWKERDYEIIKYSKLDQIYDGVKKGWTPNYNSTFKMVKPDELPLFNKYISKPFFGIDLLDDNYMGVNLTSSVDNPTQKEMHYPLNSILYGPPGTGKTYYTKEMALNILGENTDGLSREKITSRYKKYSEERRIEFVTFHQSFSYEDFVEGIKPILADKESDSNGELSYDIEDGIFKIICNRAEKKNSFVKTQKYNPEEVKYYKMSLGGKKQPFIHSWCIQNGYAALGWGEDKDFSKFIGITDWSEFRDKFKETYPDLYNERRYSAQALFIFMKMEIGDIVIATKGNYKIDAIGRVAGEYEYRDDTPIEFYQFRKVDWILKDLDSPVDEFVTKNISQQSIYEFDSSDVKKEYIKGLMTSDRKDPSKYVLIIDEINRGNVAGIFGELITLIEPDKRVGQPEELTVRLPYSKKSFSVPDNVYIIGTMNTADRSVEALDTALRRRFSFMEIMPNPDLISPEYLITSLWYKYRDGKWKDEAYKTKARALYELLGAENLDAEKEKEIRAVLPGSMPNCLELVSYFEGVEFKGLNLKKLLTAINLRITKLLDRDHQIGHSYFMKLIDSDNPFEELRTIFEENIIPLLKEYFYGNPQRIGLILGKDFVKRVDDSTIKLKPGFDAEELYLDDKHIYSIGVPNNIDAFIKIYE